MAQHKMCQGKKGVGCPPPLHAMAAPLPPHQWGSVGHPLKLPLLPRASSQQQARRHAPLKDEPQGHALWTPPRESLAQMSQAAKRKKQEKENKKRMV